MRLNTWLYSCWLVCPIQQASFFLADAFRFELSLLSLYST